jgi:3-oxoacyl-[acyl-carrier protein] reductase
VAVVSGLGPGMGRDISIALATEGADIVMCARSEERMSVVAAEVAELGRRAVTVQCDITSKADCERVADTAKEELGHVDILVNNAGGSRPLPVDAPEERWEEAMTLNFTRVRQLTHTILPGMMARKWGRILNISGKSEPFGLNAAFAAKAAIHAWAKGLSRDVGKFAITVNSIAPGRIISEQILRNYPPEERKKFSAEEIPLGAYGQPEDLAVLAVFLSSPLAHYITGTVIPVDGGLRRYQF